VPGEEMLPGWNVDLSWFDDVVPFEPLPFKVPESDWMRSWDDFYREALRMFEEPEPPRALLGVSPLEYLATRQGRDIPRQEVDLSFDAMGLLRDALDATLEYYGTSGELEPRGFWMKLDGDAS
jgi:hypothetical protein